MLDRKVRVAIIGAGTVARDNQLPAYMKCRDAEVAAVCDMDHARASALAEQFDIPKVYTDMHALLADGEVDAVSICTGNSTHEGIVTACARAGKHILCEKPMAVSAEQARRMQDEVKKSGVTFMMAFVNRYRQESRIIREFVDLGKLGDVYHARCGWIRRRGTPRGWFTDVKKSGGGPVIDIGVHVIDLTWYMMGKPRPISVSGVVHHRIGSYQTKYVNSWVAGEQSDLPVTTEDSATALIRFENQVSMSVDVSWAINGREKDMFSEIYGSKGGASLNPFAFYGEENGYLVDTIPQLCVPGGWQPAFEEEIRHFVDCVKNGKEPVSGIEDGVMVQKMLGAIYESSAQQREIAIV
ncbi:MAG: Gfo/Idh/MocA family oxidoreductase [Oscillospiraceae bacterium]|nr:Gfo/Idh/MocA family oxidoreductase [Oscillospiraceae bacterium]